jgi:putative transposase
MAQHSGSTGTNASKKASRPRNPPRSRPRTAARRRAKAKARRRKAPPDSTRVSERLARSKKKAARQQQKQSYRSLRQGVLKLVTRRETEKLARETGYYQREPQQLRAFEFALCCALSSVVEFKRGFASVWRLLGSMAQIEVARSAVTQRFGPGSAKLLEALFLNAVERLPAGGPSVLRERLNEFHEVLAQDGTVLQLSPVLAALFPATRTNVVGAAAKVHVTADLVGRRVIGVTVTGERESELGELYVQGFTARTLYLVDLGYTSYDLLWDIQHVGAFVLMRLKENANPTVVRVRQGVRAPRQAVGRQLKELDFCQTQDRFDLDARFPCQLQAGTSVEMRVVGLWDAEAQCYHRYITNLPAETWGVEELATLYRQRWIIELLMKLLKSHCHLDHLDTANPEALRTLIYASLLAAVILQSLLVTAAQAAGIPPEQISFLTVGVMASLLVVPLLWLWLGRKLSRDEMAAMILRAIAIGCCDQNPGRTRENHALLS